MANRKRKTQKKQKKTKIVVRARRPIPRHKANPVPHGLVSAVCSVTDPFCEHARGAKWHDSSSINSMAYTVRGAVPITTDANGSACVLMVPGWPYVSAQGVVTGNTAAFTDYDILPISGTISSAVGKCRVVSGGYSFVSTTSMSNSQGYVVAQDLAAPRAADITSILVETPYNNGYIRQPLRDPKPFSFVFRSGGPGSRDWFDTVTGSPVPVNTTDSHDWSVSTVGVKGGPASTQVGVIDYVIHYELQFVDGNSLSTLATPARGANSLITDAAASLHSKVTPFFPGYQDKVSKMLQGYAKQAIVNALPMAKVAAIRGIAAYTGPAGGMIAQYLIDGPYNNNMHTIMDAD